jgi:hypothetical protein
MTNLPTSGQGNSLDNFNVDRADYRQGMQNLLAFLAEGLGGIPVGTFTTQAVDPAKVSASLGWTRTGTTLAPKTAGDVVTFSAGTAALPGLAVVGDPNTGIFSPGADTLTLGTGGVGRLYLDSLGQVSIGGPAGVAAVLSLGGIGTGSAPNTNGFVSHIAAPKAATASFSNIVSVVSTQPASTHGEIKHFCAAQGAVGAGSVVTKQYGFFAGVDITHGTNTYGYYGGMQPGTNRWNFYSAGTADSYFASNNFIFANGGAERARFDAAGRLLIGGSTSFTGSALQVFGGITSAAVAQRAEMGLWRFNGTSGAPTAVVANDVLGRIYALGYDGAAYQTAARIEISADSAPSASSMPGRISMLTTPSGSILPLERLRIKSTGVVNIAVATTYADNTAAKTAGLVVGDIYRKADGTLMITF